MTHRFLTGWPSQSQPHRQPPGGPSAASVSVTAMHMSHCHARGAITGLPAGRPGPIWKSVCCCPGGGRLLSSWSSQHSWAWLQAPGEAGDVPCLSLSAPLGHFPFGLRIQPHLLLKSPLFCFRLTLCLPVAKSGVFLVGCRCERDTCCGWEGRGEPLGRLSCAHGGLK